MTPTQHALFLGCVLIAGYVQNLTGFALGLVMLGLVGLTHAAPLADVTNVVSVLTLVNAIALFRGAKPEFDRAVMAPTVAASLVGVAIGVGLLAWLDAHVLVGLRLLLGLTIVACAAVLMLQTRPLRERSPGATFAAYGLVSGVLGGLFSTAGPPLVYHFYRQPMALRAIRDALVTSFAANAVVRLALMLAVGHLGADSWRLCLEAVPVIAAQAWWMARSRRPWRPQTVKRLVCLLLLVIGAGLALPAMRSLLGQ